MRQSVMYSNSLVRMETDGIYISIKVEIATEGICRGAETTQNLPVQVNAVWQQMVLLLQSSLNRLASPIALSATATEQGGQLVSAVDWTLRLLCKICVCGFANCALAA